MTRSVKNVALVEEECVRFSAIFYLLQPDGTFGHDGQVSLSYETGGRRPLEAMEDVQVVPDVPLLSRTDVQVRTPANVGRSEQFLRAGDCQHHRR